MKRPKVGTFSALVWDRADLGATPVEIQTEIGGNMSTIKTQYSRWKACGHNQSPARPSVVEHADVSSAGCPVVPYEGKDAVTVLVFAHGQDGSYSHLTDTVTLPEDDVADFVGARALENKFCEID